MATTVVELRDSQDYAIGGIDVDGVRELHCTLVGPAAYATAGETFVSLFADLVGKTIVNVICGVGKDWTARLLAGKLAWFVASTGVEVANAANLSTSGVIPAVIYYR